MGNCCNIKKRKKASFTLNLIFQNTKEFKSIDENESPKEENEILSIS